MAPSSEPCRSCEGGGRTNFEPKPKEIGELFSKKEIIDYCRKNFKVTEVYSNEDIQENLINATNLLSLYSSLGSKEILDSCPTVDIVRYMKDNFYIDFKRC